MLSSKNKTLTLTLVIPVFNEEGYLNNCLGSVAAQTHMPAQVIVVNNNSSDKSADVARQYPFVTLLNEKKPGVLHARNLGFKAANGNIIARIDADTFLPPRWVENAIRSFEDKSISAVTGPVDYYDMPLPSRNHFFDHIMRSSIYNWSPKSPFLYGSNMAIRADAWRSVESGLCRDNYLHEDLDLAIHLHQQGKKILYTKNLMAGASGRRYNDKPKKFYRYMYIYRQTYLRHNMHSLAIYSATGVYWIGYVLVHPWLNVWYGLYGLLKPLTPLSKASRKNPMNW
jgi:glycosyltransferase involved in cell wall biosynthesis